MDLKELSYKHEKLFIALLGAALGAITYISIYGFRLLDVTHTIWLYNKNDLTQHYAGWLFFFFLAGISPLG